jgi:D-alanyl-D-alanine carboxypeptidase
VVHRRTLALAVTLTVLAAAVGPAGAAIGAAVQAPSCGYADVTTRYRAPSDWYRALLDTTYRLAASDAPRDLVPVSRAGLSGGGTIRSLVIADLAAMARAARAARAPFAVESAYRSYSSQVWTFAHWVNFSGRTRALLASARPGHSEHQLGTSLDFKTPGGVSPWYFRDWATTRAGAWLAANAWKFGFVMSYPKGRSPSFTCYQYEPWHYRYVGRAIAQAIHDASTSPRQWLISMGATSQWSWGAPSPSPVPSPVPTPEPTPGPVPTPTLAPTPTPEPTPSLEPTPAETAAPSPDVPVPAP